VATQARQLDRSSVEARVFAVARDLLDELGNPQARDAVRGSAQLDRDLGLGSLERVELLVRLSQSLSATLPDRVVAEADTLNDVVAALTEVTGTQAISPRTSDRPSSITDQSPLREHATDVPTSAETWQEVLRHRAHADAERVHLILWEEGAEAERVSFGELYRGAKAVASRLAARGIGRGDAVSLMLPTSRDFFLTFAGVLLAGAVPVPIYPPVRADRIAEYAERQSAILHNANVRLLVTVSRSRACGQAAASERALAAKYCHGAGPALRN
jgi:fatty-acyl-CoA synthase